MYGWQLAIMIILANQSIPSLSLARYVMKQANFSCWICKKIKSLFVGLFYIVHCRLSY